MRFQHALPAGLIVVGAALPASAAEGGSQALLTPHIGTVFWTLLTFAAMAFILSRYAWKPMLGALAAREQSIQGSLDQARRDREEAEKLLGQQRELLTDAHRLRSEALEQGRRDAEKVKADMLQEANRQREQLLKQTEAQVQDGIRQARGEMRTLASDLAILAAEKLLGQTLDGDKHRRLVDEYLSDLEKPRSGTSLN